MKKILGTLGILLIVALLGLWVYLLVYGSPVSDGGVFSKLGFDSPTTERELQDADTKEVQVGISATDGVPQQISTRPVAGFVLLDSGNENQVRYAEKGTGHVYEIDFNAGTEKRVSGITVAKVTNAFFSPSGNKVVLVSDAPAGQRVASLLDLKEGNNTSEFKLPNNLEDVFFASESHLLYTTIKDGLKTASELELENFSTKVLWESPMTDVVVYFSIDKAFLVNKPAPNLYGNTYIINNEGILPVGTGGYAYNALVDTVNNKMLETYFDSETNLLRSSVLDLENKSASNLTIVAIPEKCAFDSTGMQLWCGVISSSSGAFTKTKMNDWYAGRYTFSDSLRYTPDISIDATYLKYDFLEQAGYTVDVTNLTTGKSGKILIFKNKLNDTLWMYRIPQDEPVTTNDGDESQTPGQ